MDEIEVYADETVFRNDDNGYTVLVVKSGKTRVLLWASCRPSRPAKS